MSTLLLPVQLVTWYLPVRSPWSVLTLSLATYMAFALIGESSMVYTAAVLAAVAVVICFLLVDQVCCFARFKWPLAD
jgi:hypothetical protein